MASQTNQIFIDVQHTNTKVALLENGELTELIIERNSRVKSVGNIYKGVVKNVLPGMNAAFVSIGLEKNGYLFVGDTLVDKSDLAGAALPPSSLNVSVGDVVMVQVVKDASGTKGARVTQDVTVPGRFLVYMPYVDYIGISRKIEDEQLREKLHKLVDGIRAPRSGFIVRTAAATATTREIKQDAKFLVDTFNEAKARFENAPVPSCVYNDGDLVFRTVRDMYTSETECITVSGQETYDYVKSILKRISPRHHADVKLFSGGRDMFKECKIDLQVDALLQKKVWLKNGAYLVIDKTEALTVIDVNTGKYVGAENLEETVFLTNMLAAREIARQVRLRNMGGIIVTDFIDMTEEEHQKKVVEELTDCLKRDRIKTTVVGMTGLGLVEITRKKTRNDTSSMLMQRCPYCNGDGVVYSNEHIVAKIRVGLLDAFADGAKDAVVTVHPDVFEALFRSRLLSKDIETVWQKKRIYAVPEGGMHLYDYKITPSSGGILTLPPGAKMLY